MIENPLEWSKNHAIKTAEGLLDRKLSLSELSIIGEAKTMEEVPSKFDEVMKLNHPEPQYKEPQVKTYEPKIGHNLTGPLTIPAGTDLKELTVSGTFLPADEYANTLTLKNSDIQAYSLAPQMLCMPILNTMVRIPINNPTLKVDMIEKGIDFIADLMAIDGVKEVLEKYGAEIKPL